MDTLKLIVEDIKKETADTSTFFLREASGDKISYEAGQFLTLVFSHHNEEITRSYSLSSSPDDELLSIAVKRIPNGEISRFLLTHVKVGDTLNAIPPAGRFVLPADLKHKQLVFFAAGSGIVPVYAQIKYALNRYPDKQFFLVYSSQSADGVIFKTELDNLSAVNKNLTIHYLISEEGKRLNNAIVEKLINQFSVDSNDSLFYICGPFAYMRMVRMSLHYLGVHDDLIKRENFVLETVPVTSPVTNFPPREIRIKYKGDWHDIIVGENQSILQAALQNKISLPYSCRSGMCSACFTKCTSGRVEIIKNEVLTPDDIKNGYILTCTGHPVTDDVVIEYKD